jgi:hypothetical protein
VSGVVKWLSRHILTNVETLVPVFHVPLDKEKYSKFYMTACTPSKISYNRLLPETIYSYFKIKKAARKAYMWLTRVNKPNNSRL